MYKCPVWGVKNIDRLFSVVSGERMGGNRHKLEYRKILFKCKKKLFPSEGCQKRERVALSNMLQLTVLQAGTWIRVSRGACPPLRRE